MKMKMKIALLLAFLAFCMEKSFAYDVIGEDSIKSNKTSCKTITYDPDGPYSTKYIIECIHLGGKCISLIYLNSPKNVALRCFDEEKQ